MVRLMAISDIKNKKWIKALGILAIVAVAAAGLFREFGCEKGAAVTDTVGTVLDGITPEETVAVEDPDSGVVIEDEPEHEPVD